MGGFGPIVGRLDGGGMVRCGEGRRLLSRRRLRDGRCATGGCATGACGSCFTCCPKYSFTIEKPPKICFKSVCSKPMCDPCDIRGQRLLPDLLAAWAYPPNYSHCPVPPPGVLASQPPPLVAAPGVTAPEEGQDDALPPPRKPPIPIRIAKR